jgi:membrane-associated protein
VSYDTLINSISHFGYAALFFALWLGIVGMPIPDEVIVMTGGAVSQAGLLQTIPAFIVTYLGVIFGLSLGYVLGRFIGSPILDRLRRKKSISKHLKPAEELVAKYGSFALIFSYFIPVIRHIVPYLVGINKMPYHRYMLYSFSTGFVWTFLFFLLGYFAGAHVQNIGNLIYHYGLYVGVLLIGIVLIFMLFKFNKKKQNQ